MSVTIREATAADETGMLNILPQLADFDLPPQRNPRHLWEGDAKLLRKHIAGSSDNTRVLVAVSDNGDVVGLALLSLVAELLSGESSSHLEALVVDAAARGQGLGRRLLTEAQTLAKQAGARSMSLHAFARNTLARGLYESTGFDGELIRYTKPLSDRDPGEQR
ncbi:MAG: GNAT family N-acetyltransferase [Pseudomonadota bacterium]